jgi:transposase
VDLTHDGLFHIGGRPDGPADRLARVERELQQARAEALGRTGERLQTLLDQVAALDRQLDAMLAEPGPASGASRLASELDARNRLRDQAMQVRQQLVIQREAVGLRRQAPVEQCYPVPKRRQLPGPAGDQGRAS